MTLQLPVSSAELTRAEQKILDFINTNPDTFLFSSIGQLAQRLELSDATLSRFARHVGCQDFKELKNLVLEQSASVQPSSWQAPCRRRAFRFLPG